ncbi:SulP family inorganic anion transporter [Trinickia caryophylli]|uniref:SulP family inorganic anion transporter n=1 Tax=Trinickia caryophylli TaxID=28094 RepID=UPI003B9752A1
MPHFPDEPGASRFDRLLPGVGALRQYRLSWLRHDALAGVTLSTVLIPSGLAYAAAAGMPPVSGLYASLAALLAYAVFGPSRILILGPDSALIALVAASAAFTAGRAGQATELGGALALMSGVICIAVGLLRLGFVADLLSTPIRYGYLNGTMLTIAIAQLPKMLGFSAQGTSFVDQGPARSSKGSPRDASISLPS